MFKRVSVLFVSFLVFLVFLIIPPINSKSPDHSSIFISTPFFTHYYSSLVHYRVICSENFLNTEVSLCILKESYRFIKNITVLSPTENLYQDISKFPVGEYLCYLSLPNMPHVPLSNTVTISVKTEPPQLIMKDWNLSEPKKALSRNMQLEAVSFEKLKQVSLYVNDQIIPMEDYGFSWKWNGFIPLKKGLNDILMIGTNYHQVSSRQLLQVILEEESYTERIPVLVYHNIGFMQGLFNVTPDVFESHILDLIAKGCYFADPDELLLFYQGRIQLPEKTVLLTFDDGYRGVLEYALPVLQKYQVKATLFIVTSYIGKPTFLTWNQLDEIAYSKLVTIASHSHHLHFYQKLPHLPVNFPAIIRYKINGETENAYQQRILEDLKTSRDLLRNRYRKEVLYFAYPFGAYDKEAADLVKKAGFKLAFSYNSQQKKLMSRGSNQFILERYPVFQYSTSNEIFKETR